MGRSSPLPMGPPLQHTSPVAGKFFTGVHKVPGSGWVGKMSMLSCQLNTLWHCLSQVGIIITMLWVEIPWISWPFILPIPVSRTLLREGHGGWMWASPMHATQLLPLAEGGSSHNTRWRGPVGPSVPGAGNRWEKTHHGMMVGGGYHIEPKLQAPGPIPCLIWLHTKIQNQR